MRFFLIIFVLGLLPLTVSCGGNKPAEPSNDTEQLVTPEKSTDHDTREPVTVRVAKNGGDYSDLETAVEAVPPKSTIELDTGHYELTSPLLITKSLTINGAGVDSTLISTSAGSVTILYEADGLLAINDLAIERMESEFAGDVMRALAGKVTLENCRISGGMPSEDESISGFGLGILNTEATITNCEVEKNGGGGFLIGDDAIAVIKNSSCSNNAIGIGFSGNASGEIRDSICAGNQGSGIVVLQAAKVDIINNNILDNGGPGIDIDSENPDIILRDNNIQNNAVDLWGTDIMIWSDIVPDLKDNKCSHEEKSFGYNADMSGIVILSSEMRPASPAFGDNVCAVAKCIGVTMFDVDCKSNAPPENN